MELNQILKQIKIYDTKEIILSNGKRMCYLIDCNNCGIKHYKAQCEIIKGVGRNKKFFCTKECHSEFHKTKQKVICVNCDVSFYKLPNQIAKTKNNFCSKSCAAIYNNKNKKFGTRRSKIEILIDQMISDEFPYIIFKPNDKITIGSELDFYFPHIKLAIQINGPLHYLPIYGKEKFERIKKLDEEKRTICNSLHIKLIELDYSSDKYLNKILISKRLNEIRNILAEEVGLDPNALTNTTSFPN